MPVDPAHLHIVHYPAPVLRRKADPVGEVTDEVRAVAERMVALMREAEGIGLAAPQVGLSWRMFVMDVPPGDERSAADDPPTATDGPVVCIDPEVLEPAGDLESMSEGCLSLPEITGQIIRPPTVLLRARGIDGNPFKLRAGGLLARCIQHEHDHLEGVLIIDKMGQMDRLRNRAAIRSLEREGGER